jgi:ketosteroid isomerase-like protein
VSAADDRAAIAALVHAYAERLDGGDLDGVADLFAHATWQGRPGERVLTGRDEVRRAYRPVVLYDGVPRTRHLITNLVVELDAGGDTASARSYFTVVQATPDLPLQPILAGRYHDRFERAGEWRFAERLILPDLWGDLSRHYRLPLTPS